MSTKEDNRLLNDILSRGSSSRPTASNKAGMRSGMPMSLGDEGMYDDEDDDDFTRGICQWTSHDGKKFIPASKTALHLPPGAYEIKHSNSAGIYFELVEVKIEDLIRFPETNSDKVICEITKFWEREHLFREYGLTYKRGICLWGPPGSGKSCTIRFIMKDVIERRGIVIKFTAPHLFTEGMRLLRDIEPTTPIVVLMEDIDGILEIYSESDVLNLLDGVDRIENIVFIATTNYPEQLGERIINRPSRFDKRYFIGYPNAESRKIYFESLIGTEKIAELGLNIERWVAETEDLSIAHLKELFVAVVIQGDEYEDAIETLQSMKQKVRGDRDDKDEGTFGFS
jgi:AAA+ superfamily predicted ATPase